MSLLEQCSLDIEKTINEYVYGISALERVPLTIEQIIYSDEHNMMFRPVIQQIKRINQEISIHPQHPIPSSDLIFENGTAWGYYRDEDSKLWINKSITINGQLEIISKIIFERDGKVLIFNDAHNIDVRNTNLF